MSLIMLTFALLPAGMLQILCMQNLVYKGLKMLYTPMSSLNVTWGLLLNFTFTGINRAVQTSTHTLCFSAKIIMYTLVNSNFTI